MYDKLTLVIITPNPLVALVPELLSGQSVGSLGIQFVLGILVYLGKLDNHRLYWLGNCRIHQWSIYIYKIHHNHPRLLQNLHKELLQVMQ